MRTLEMPPPEKAEISRPLYDVACEVRADCALYPQDYPDQSIQRSNSALIVELRVSSVTYQNTGIQTLPPPNGGIFRLIHGREPSHIDYVRNMGSAGMGRFTDDPRSNHYDLIYGSAYPAPSSTSKGTYTDSAFQTTSHEISRKALAKAKVKASITANKYRDAAARAGYVICAESQEDMIAHSEQFSKAVRLDVEGNLLEGTIQNRGLPNICGVSVRPVALASRVTRSAVVHNIERRPKHTAYEYHGTIAGESLHPSASQSPTVLPQILTKDLHASVASIAAFAPSVIEQASDARLVLDNEYGSAEPGTEEFVIYDAGVKYRRPGSGLLGTRSSSRKRNLNDDCPPSPPSKKLQASALEVSRSLSVSITPPAVSPLNQPDQDCNTLVRAPESDQKATSGSPQFAHLRPGDAVEARAWTITQSGTKPELRSENIASITTDAHSIQEQKSRRKSSKAQTDDTMEVASRTEGSASSRAGDNPSHRQSSKLSKMSQHARTGSTSPGLAVTSEIRGSQLSPGRNIDSAATTTLSPPRWERPHGRTRPEFGDYVPDTKRRKARSIIQRRDKASNEKGHGSTKERQTSPNRTHPSQANVKQSTVRGFSSAGRPVFSRNEKKLVSRATRTLRQTIVPYVPPAMRAKGQELSKDSKIEKKQ